MSTGVSPQPLQVLYGHEDEVMSVAINTELDIAVSSSKVLCLLSFVAQLVVYVVGGLQRRGLKIIHD